MRKFNHKNTSSNARWGGVFKIAVLAALVLALACFVSCKHDDDDSSGGNYGGDKNIAGKWVGESKHTGKYGWWFFEDGTYYALYEMYIGSGVLGYDSTSKGTWARVTNKDGYVVMEMKGGTATYDAEDNSVDFVVKDGKLCLIMVWDGETKETFEKYDGELVDFGEES